MRAAVLAAIAAALVTVGAGGIAGEPAKTATHLEIAFSVRTSDGPLADAYVTLRQPGRAPVTLRSEANGAAVFREAGVAPCRVTVAAPGFETQRVPIDCTRPQPQVAVVTLVAGGPARRADAAAGSAATNADTATVIVRVRDVDGPAIGAAVALRYDNSRVPSRVLNSDENGQATFKGVLAQACRVAVSMPGYDAAEKSIPRPASRTEVDFQLVDVNPFGVVHPVMPLPAPRPVATDPTSRDDYPANGKK